MRVFLKRTLAVLLHGAVGVNAEGDDGRIDVEPGQSDATEVDTDSGNRHLGLRRCSCFGRLGLRCGGSSGGGAGCEGGRVKEGVAVSGWAHGEEDRA